MFARHLLDNIDSICRYSACDDKFGNKAVNLRANNGEPLKEAELRAMHLSNLV